MLFDALQKNQQFVTPNTRLAKALRDLLDLLLQQSARQKKIVRASPRVIPFASWNDSLRSQLLVAGRIKARHILSPLAELTLWQRAVESSANGKVLIAPALAASQAQKAYQLLCHWRVDIESCAYEFSTQPESAALLEWVGRFKELLQATHYITNAEAQQEVLEFIEQARLSKDFHLASLSHSVCAVGFQTPTPLQRDLIGVFSDDQAGVANDVSLGIQLRAQCENINVYCAENTEAETAAAAQWAQNLMQSQPDAAIAIVIPDLEQKKLQVERIMRKVFEPASERLGKIPSAASYNISAGCKLDTTPLASAYLNVLQAVLLRLDIPHWQALLSSPYLWGKQGNDNAEIAAKIITAMYEAGQLDYKAADLHKLQQWAKLELTEGESAEREFAGKLSLLTKKSQQLKLGRYRNKQQPLSTWLAEFDALLQSINWTQSRQLDTVEYQQLQRFKECFAQCANNDAVIGDVTAVQAFKLLRQQLKGTVFHRQTLVDNQTIPNVLGLLEASGQVFDYVWLSGFSDAQWPKNSKPDALLPKAFQHSLGMPFASEQREIGYLKALTGSLLQSATECVISYSASVDDVSAQLSPLVSSLLNQLTTSDRVTVNGLETTQAYKTPGVNALADTVDAKNIFENIDDYYGKPFDVKSLEPGNSVSGGTGFLQAAAGNPLRAYLRYRLGLKRLPEPLVGITALERGIALHAVLDRCWTEIKDSHRLGALDEDALHTQLQNWINQQLDILIARRFVRPPQSVVNVERKVLTDILHQWLLLERDRTAFSVSATELTVNYELEGLPFKGRIDRIDLLADGGCLLVDYKSGITTIAKWLDDDLSDPQLPFYVAALNHANEHVPVNGISFASLKPAAIGFKGLAADNCEASEISGIRSISAAKLESVESWNKLQEIWQQRLAEIAGQIKTGFAAVDANTPWSDDEYQPITRASYQKEFNQ
jgi:probable DNA repair protein